MSIFYHSFRLFSVIRIFSLFFLNIFFIFCSYANIEFQPSERPEHHFPQLQEIIQLLDENAPELLVSALKLEEAKLNQKVAAAERGFRLGANLSGFSIQEDRPNRGFDQRYKAFAAIHAQKPLYHWGALRAKESISLIEKLQAHTDLSFGKRLLIGEVRSLFLELVVLTFQKELTSEGVRLATQNLKNINQRLGQGMVSMVDVGESEIALLKQEIELSELNLLLGKEEARLRSLSGFNDVLDFTVRSPFMRFCMEYEFPINLPILVASTNTEIQQLKSLIEKEEQEVLIAESELKPKINFVGSLYQDQVDAVSNQDRVNRNNILFGLEVNWALWDSEKSKNKKRAALLRKRRHETNLSKANRELRMFTESMRKELLSLSDRIVLSRKLLLSSQLRLDKCKLEFSQNRKSSSDLLSTQLDLDDAKLSNLKAVCNYMSTLDLYEQQLGLSTFPISHKNDESE